MKLRLYNLLVVYDSVCYLQSSDTIFDGIPVRVYRPSDALNETLPAIVYYHGGGWTLGSIG